jgi:hexokinase
MNYEFSLIRFCPSFETAIRQSLVAIVGAEVESRVKIKVVKDGRAIGGTTKHSLCTSFANPRNSCTECAFYGVRV